MRFLQCNRRLLEKYAQYQEQMAQLQTREERGEVGEEEMEEILTPDEKTTAERAKTTIQKFVTCHWSLLTWCTSSVLFLYRLEAGELQLDETIMTLSNYIQIT